MGTTYRNGAALVLPSTVGTAAEGIGPQRLIELIAAAGKDPTRWEAVAAALSAQLGGAAVLLALRLPSPGDCGWLVTAEIAPEFRRAYAEGYFASDPWLRRMADRQPGVGFGYEILPRSALIHEEFYREWMQPQGFPQTPTIMGLCRTEAGRPRSTLAIFRTPATPVFQIEDVQLIRRLLPYLQRAMGRQ